MAPAYSKIEKSSTPFSYLSNEDVMSIEELESYLDELGIFGKALIALRKND